MNLLTISYKSAKNRRISLLLALISIAISISLLLAIDIIRKETRNSFVSTLSGTDLIVGARGEAINLLLYSVFRIGDATKNVTYETYQDIAGQKGIKWAIPISLGDSHRGYRVMGTTSDYFTHYQAGNQHLKFREGKAFSDLYDVVIGSEVARKLKYRLGSPLIISHGLSQMKNSNHSDKPFKLVGILKPTGTPVDKTIHVSLEAIEAIHIDWQSGAPGPIKISADMARKFNLTPKAITAFFVGLENKIETFITQRKINDYSEEALMAIIPGVTLVKLWRSIGYFENVLLAISLLVVLAGLVGLLTTLLTTLNERRREMAVLRAVGAHPWQILSMIVLEAVFVVMGGCILGVVFVYSLLYLVKPIFIEWLGLNLEIGFLSLSQISFLLGIVGFSALLGLLPGWIAYKRSLMDGLKIKV